MSSRGKTRRSPAKKAHKPRSTAPETVDKLVFPEGKEVDLRRIRSGSALRRIICKYLEDEGRDFDRHQVAHLDVAVEAFEEWMQATKLIRKHGLLVETEKHGLKANPAVIIRNVAQGKWLRAMRALGV